MLVKANDIQAIYLHGVCSPEHESVRGDGDKEGAELGALGGRIGTSVQGKVPNDEQEGNAGNGIPAPLLGSVLLAESSEQTSEDHDQVSDDGHKDVAAGHASQETEIEQQKGCGNSPVNIAGPEDLAVHCGECIRNMVVLVADLDRVYRDTVTGSHGEVRDGRGDGNDGGNGVVEALRLDAVS